MATTALKTSRIDQLRVAQNFGGAAGSYDQHAQLQRQISAQLRQQWPALAASAPVIDLGCGTGHDSEWLCQRHDLHAVDVAANMLEHCAQHCINPIQTHCCSVQQLDQIGLEVDALWSNCMLQWADDMPQAAAQIYRSLKPGGHLVASLFSAGSLQELQQAWATVDDQEHVLSLPDISSTEQAFAAAGFTIHWQQQLNTALYFPNLKAIAAHLRGLGANNAHQNRSKGLMGKQRLLKLSQALEHYRHPQGIRLSWNAWLFHAQKEA